MTGLIILGVVAVLAAFILLCVFLPAVGLTLLGIIVLLIVLVQIFQSVGTRLAAKADKRLKKKSA